MDEHDAGFIDVVWLPVAAVTPNDYNPNRMPPDDHARYVLRVVETRQLPRPVLVREVGDCYELIDGEHTLAAAMAAGMDRVPAQVLRVTRLEAMLESNRRNTHGVTNAVLKGRQYAEMKVLGDLSNRALAELEGTTEGTVRNYLAYSEAAEVRSQYAVPLGRTERQVEDEIAGLTVRDVRDYLDRSDDARDAWLDAAALTGAEGDGTDATAPKTVPRGRKSLARRKRGGRTKKGRQGEAASPGRPSPAINVTAPEETAPLLEAVEQDRVTTPTGAPALTPTREAGCDSTAVQDDSVSPYGPGMAVLLESVKAFMATAAPEEVRQLVAAVLAHKGAAAIIEAELRVRRSANGSEVA